MSSAVKKLNSPQWKNFQPPAQDPAILSYQRSPNTVNSVIMTSANPPIRETGFVEKLLHSYGFIQCCEREARLFFHFSEYSGEINDVNIGEPVEFEMSYDRRTGRPIARSVVKSNSDNVSFEMLSEERYTGSIVQEAKPTKNKNGCINGTADGLGRVTYEHNGECFFLPYGLEDIIDGEHVKVKAGDQVTFFIATDKRNGNIQARKLELVNVPPPSKYQGVVCSLKDSFGFIERADAVKEIFFHYSEYNGDIHKLELGEDVEFDIQSRNGKEVAVNISGLPEGTVIFEDIAIDKIKGKLLRTLKSNRRQSDPLGGRISYDSPKGVVEIPYGDKDQKGDYTLCVGDIVEFNIATDRRDKLQRATNIVLLDETFENSAEQRETGVVVSVKDTYGFIQCTERDVRMFFHFSEVLESSRDVKCQDEVEFTVTPDPSTPNRNMAIRIRYLPKGSVSFINIRPEKYVGTIDREPSLHRSPNKNNKDPDTGSIIFDFEGAIHHISYLVKDLLDLKSPPRYGDKVEFNIGELKRSNSRIALNVKVLFRNISTKCQGFIATLKDNYGFIENADHEKEVFFHYSSYDGDPNELDLGDEVEYTVTRKSGKISAENIRKLLKGTIAQEETLRDKGTLQGKVVRPMRIVNPDQDEYCGLVQSGVDDDSDNQLYPYGITSLADKHDFLQKGDIVKFQVAIGKGGKMRAVCIAAMRKYIRARVDSVKGQFGFINHEVEEGKKLFFHMTEVHDGVEVQPGDEVEFVVVQNQRNGKYSACSLRKITDRQRPEHLVSRLKSINEDANGPRIIAIRQPKGPDGSKGFVQPRVPKSLTA